MKMSDKLYEFLKWILITVVPAAITLIGVINTVTPIPYYEAIVTIIGASATFIGSCVGISTANYRKTK